MSSPDTNMDWLQFFSAIFASAAWPAVAVIMLLLMRKQVQQLFPLMRRLKYKDLEIDFAERLEQAEEMAEAANLPPPPTLVIEGSVAERRESKERETLIELAKISPRAAIGEAWRLVDNDIRAALAQRGLDAPPNFVRLVPVAAEHGILPEQVLSLAEQLRNLRNKAVHSPAVNIDLATAIEYIEIAERVRRALPAQRNREPPPPTP